MELLRILCSASSHFGVEPDAIKALNPMWAFAAESIILI